ncbi:MAG: SCO4226 family nickel-binding protein [Kofleriaceae bacterium]
MTRFIDIHTGMKGITKEKLAEVHNKDISLQSSERVRFLHTWADPATGKVFCLSEAPSKEAVQRVHQRAGHPSDEIYEVSVEVE